MKNLTIVTGGIRLADSFALIRRAIIVSTLLAGAYLSGGCVTGPDEVASISANNSYDYQLESGETIEVTVVRFVDFGDLDGSTERINMSRKHPGGASRILPSDPLYQDILNNIYFPENTYCNYRDNCQLFPSIGDAEIGLRPKS